MLEIFAAFREFRRPIGLIAAGFVVLQSLLAGLSGAQAAARVASGEFAILCHGNPDGFDPANGAATSVHDCCAVCTTSWPATGAPKTAGLGEPMDVAGHAAPSMALRDTVPIPARAVRSGPSQAPPILG